MAIPLLGNKEFEELDLATKNTVVQNALLNSIYETLRENKSKLPDLVKAQTMLIKYINQTTRNKDPFGNFSSTPLTNEPPEPNETNDLPIPDK